MSDLRESLLKRKQHNIEKQINQRSRLKRPQFNTIKLTLLDANSVMKMEDI